MSEIVHESRQNHTTMLIFTKGYYLAHGTMDRLSFMVSFQSLHLHLTEVSSSAAVFESAMGRSWIHLIVRTELEQISQSLHGGVVHEFPNVIWQV